MLIALGGIRIIRNQAPRREMSEMAKASHPGKREALKKYKVLFIQQLQMEIPMKQFWDYQDEILANPELGINRKTLDKAEHEALVARKKQLQS